MQNKKDHQVHWLDKPILTTITVNWETAIFIIILIIGILTRFYDLESRVMSHDENSHVYYSWRLSKGEGYQHTPLTHGPLLFHLTAISYFFFGDNDFTARIPFALFNIATIGFLWFFRKYLGRIGTLLAAVLMVISPYMLYYARYVRNEALVGLFGLITLWSILRYLETGHEKYTYWLVAATALHFSTKETSFIYTAQALIFLGLVFIYQILKNQNWIVERYRKIFILTLIIGFLFLAITGGIGLIFGNAEPIPTEGTEPTTGNISYLTLIPLALCGLSLLLGVYFALRGLTWKILKQNRPFSLMLLLLTLVLPHLVAFPVRMVGWDPMEYQTWEGILRVAGFLIPFALVSIGIGLAWNRKLWLINAAIFYIPFTLLFTTFFMNGQGFFTGLVGSLGYWLEQQGVERGSQPWYYYAFLQIPIYEFLPALGCLIAGYFGIFRKRSKNKMARDIENHDQSNSLAFDFNLVPILLGYWTITSLIAYSIAGEKMPWLTFHITLPMILLTGWVIGRIIQNVNWHKFKEKKGFLLLIVMIILIISMSSAFGSLFGSNPPFQGRELSQLNTTNTFMAALIVTIATGWGTIKLLNDWEIDQVGRIGILTILAFLGLITVRSAFRAAYINYDNATEYLVYAHSGSGPKIALEQIEELSERTTDGLDIVVAYDDETTYPYWWYLRNYPKAKFYGANPTRELREAPVILVGDSNFSKLEPVVGQAYHQFEYIRIWWPDQDYYNLTWERIKDSLMNPDMREAIFQIWYNRDFNKYAEIKGKDMSLSSWEPSDKMRLYVRKDIASQVWNYGLSPIFTEELLADPYEGKGITFPAMSAIGVEGDDPGEFNKPRDITIAPDGSIYVSDTGNHRIQHLDKSGNVLHVWGVFADSGTGEAPPGTFYEPWGIDVGPDGSVYVADTWNHRIQKFSKEGKFITQWGYFGQGESGDAFWGPRDLVFDSDGHLFVTDTGNKRVAVFDQNGQFITEFGSAGLLEGQFDEPVGITIDSHGRIIIADTWNQRVQVFSADIGNLDFAPMLEWDIVGWYGQSLENKPFITTDTSGNIYVSDPEGYRILQFDSQGEFVKFWGDYGTGLDGFNLPTGLVFDEGGLLWVVDSGNNRILTFTPPSIIQSEFDEE